MMDENTGTYTEQYMPWIQKIARQMWYKYNKFYEYDDLLGIAYVAAIESEKSYDPTKAKFSAFVKPRIEGAIIRATSNISSSQHRTLLQIHSFIDQYLEEYGRIPAQHIILSEVGIKENKFMELIDLTASIRHISLHDIESEVVYQGMDMDSLAEFDKIQDIVNTLPKEQQKDIMDFLQDQSMGSDRIKQTIAIIRNRLKIGVDDERL